MKRPDRTLSLSLSITDPLSLYPCQRSACFKVCDTGRTGRLFEPAPGESLYEAVEVCSVCSGALASDFRYSTRSPFSASVKPRLRKVL